MSYHAIENLVESTILIIERSNLSIEEQRNLIYNLYQFQNRFDTSYTTLRCFSFLEKIGYIKKLPVDQHPDYKSDPEYFASIEENWIPSNIDQADEGDVVFYEDGFIFPEYGSDTWKRLVEEGKWSEAKEEPQEIPALNLISTGIELAEKYKDKSLMHDFYLAFLNAFFEFDISSEDGIPKYFEDWTNNGELLKLRELFIQHSLLSIKKKETEFEIPSRTNELGGFPTPDEKAKIEFLMDSKKTVDKIYTSYLKNKKSLENIAENVLTVENYVNQKIESSDYSFLSYEVSDDLNTHKWLCFKDVKTKVSNSRIFNNITLDVEFSSIFIDTYVQYDLLMKWQNVATSTKIENAHFKTSLFELIPYDKEFEKKLNVWGLWLLPLKSKDQAVIKSLDEFFTIADNLDGAYLAKIETEFPEKFFSKPYQYYIDIFESEEPIEDFILIKNLYSISLLFIYKLVGEGKLKEALEINNQMEERLSDRFRESIPWYKKHYLPYIKAIKKGQKPELPQFFQRN